MVEFVTRNQITQDWIAFRLSGFEHDTYIQDGYIDSFSYMVDLSSISGRCCLTRSLLWVEDHREATLMRLRGTLPQTDREPLELDLIKVEWDKKIAVQRLKYFGKQRSLDLFTVRNYPNFICVEFRYHENWRDNHDALSEVSGDMGWWLDWRGGKSKEDQWVSVYRVRHELASRYMR